MNRPLLRAEALSRRYEELEIVAGASLTVAAEEAVALVGPSGCGKTTLLQMLGLLDRPSAGRLFLDGEEPWTLPASARARLRLTDIGFVFQQNNLLGHASARDNVALPAWRLSGSRRRALSHADDMLERFGLAHRRETRAAQLSIGEAQRVAIARAIANRPRLVLADEPTGSLDSASAEKVLAALDEIRRAGSALLLVTHDPAVARRADRVIEMRDGRVSAPSVAADFTSGPRAEGPS